ncbi:MAG: M20/M25/M40 family metallo-hydrolase [Anaerolineae bacterium]|nr:M20/M25/M40 family metallo-hydrolase [Anaerolineae bacterium]
MTEQPLTDKPATHDRDLLRDLSELIGVSGEEDAVRDWIACEIRELVDDLIIDPVGNLLAVRRGTGESDLRVMAAAHMDEVGMIVTGFDSDGTIRFSNVGGLDARILPGSRVLVGPDHIPGVILWPPIHVNKSMDTVPISNLRIDIGSLSKNNAQNGIELGDRIAFDSPFIELGPTVRGKALDDRAGCASLIKLMQADPFPFDLHVAFTVQEEVGLRGAQVAAQRIAPDMAFVLETTACHDLPQDESEPDHTTITQMGGGPVITVTDRTTVSDPRLVRHLLRVGDAAGIPHQFRSPMHAGGTDAGTIHRTRGGVPSVTVANPCRYLHGPNLIMSLEDWANQARLLDAAWRALTPDVLSR